MTKLSTLSAAALVAAVATIAAAPAFAHEGSKLFDNSYYIQQLRYEGLNVVAADEVTGDTFRATIVAPDGHTVFKFFNKDSLQPIKQ
ncbi:MAG TPA: hypothetical protein VHA07_00515 [Devosia sp.]|nr:hypothetical protein [Devosia sp.]